MPPPGKKRAAVNGLLIFRLLTAPMRILLLTLFTLLPFAAQAQSFCGDMSSPAAELKYISRGFAHGHTGLDMMAPEGSAIRAAAGGTGVYAG